MEEREENRRSLVLELDLGGDDETEHLGHLGDFGFLEDHRLEERKDRWGSIGSMQQKLDEPTASIITITISAKKKKKRMTNWASREKSD